MITLDRAITPAGRNALETERALLRHRRAASFLRRSFGARTSHLDDAALAAFTAVTLARLADEGLTVEQDQLGALALVIHWGPGWQADAMPLGLLHAVGRWEGRLGPRQVLSRSLAALDLWHDAISRSLADRNRTASVLRDLYSEPRLVARRGLDPANWCAEFAPQLWQMLPNDARAGHCVAAAARARRHLPDRQDEAMFACIGLTLGVGFDDNPQYPQFRAALAKADVEERRVALGQALVAFWQQIEEGAAG